MRITFVSDLHLGIINAKNTAKRYLTEIEAQHPDLILIGGDIIDYDLASVCNQHLEQELSQLHAPLGVYAVTGNHEYIKVKDELNEAKIDWLKNESGIKLLRDTTILVNDAFYLVGRDDLRSPRRKKLSEIMANIDNRLPIIYLNHEPKKKEVKADIKNFPDIALYGHTHDGQLFPFNLLIRFLFEDAHGFERKNNTVVYVSSGLGLAGPQYRVGTQSEIVNLDIQFK